MAFYTGCAAMAPMLAPMLGEAMKDPETRGEIIDTTIGATTNAVAWGKSATTNATAWAKTKLPSSETSESVEKHPTHFVSVKRAALRSKPTELSDAVAVLNYETGVKAVEDVAVELPFDGDSAMFPSNLVPRRRGADEKAKPGRPISGIFRRSERAERERHPFRRGPHG